VKLCVAQPVAIMVFRDGDIKMSVSADAMILSTLGRDSWPKNNGSPGWRNTWVICGMRSRGLKSKLVK